MDGLDTYSINLLPFLKNSPYKTIERFLSVLKKTIGGELWNAYLFDNELSKSFAI